MPCLGLSSPKLEPRNTEKSGGSNHGRQDFQLSFTRRRLLQTSAGALGAAGTVGLYAPAVIGQARPFAGVTLNVSCWNAPYPKLLRNICRSSRS